MKAAQDFVIYTNKEGTRVPYKQGDDKTNIKEIEVKKGDEIPKEYLKDFVTRNIEYVDVKFVNKQPILPEGWKLIPKKVPKTMIIKKRKYSQESLTVIYNKKGQDGIQKIAEEEFGIVVKRYTRYSKIVNDILKKQEEMR